MQSQILRPGWARTASQSGTDSSGFAGDSSQTMSASAGGAPVWSNGIASSPHGANSEKATLVPKYEPLATASFVPGFASARTHAVTAAVPEPKRIASPPSSAPSASSAAAPVGWA